MLTAKCQSVNDGGHVRVCGIVPMTFDARTVTRKHIMICLPCRIRNMHANAAGAGEADVDVFTFTRLASVTMRRVRGGERSGAGDALARGSRLHSLLCTIALYASAAGWVPGHIIAGLSFLSGPQVEGLVKVTIRNEHIHVCKPACLPVCLLSFLTGEEHY